MATMKDPQEVKVMASLSIAWRMDGTKGATGRKIQRTYLCLLSFLSLSFLVCKLGIELEKYVSNF